MRIAMFGGSFNPVHIGHVKLVEAVLNEFSLDKVIIMPTYHTPLKDNSQFADSEHRYNMCRIAFSGNSRVEVSDLEIKRRGNSYTYMTLNSIKELYSEGELYLVVGADMFLGIQTWKNPSEIFKLATLIAVPRDCNDDKLKSHYDNVLRKMGCKAEFMSHDIMSVSSTMVREALKNGVYPKNFLDKRVYEYITENGLYR